MSDVQRAELSAMAWAAASFDSGLVTSSSTAIGDAPALGDALRGRLGTGDVEIGARHAGTMLARALPPSLLRFPSLRP